jgi:putative membrane protein (TIGR04086 family)
MNVINYFSVIRGFTWALVISVISSLLITLLLHFTSISEAFLPSFATLIFFLSILLGSTISARNAGNRGLIHGLLVGLSYLLFSLILGLVFSNDPFSWLLFVKKITYTLIGGSLGGIIGIGLTNN